MNKKKNCIFWGSLHSMIRLSLSCSPAIISPISMYMWNKETIWKELLKLESKIWQKYIYFLYLGGSWGTLTSNPGLPNFQGLVCWSLSSLCHSNGHIETMPAREINPFTAVTRIRSQFLRTQWSTSNHQRVDMTTPHTAQPSGLASDFQGSKTSSQSRQMHNKENKATRSPEISCEQVQKLTPQFLLYRYIYWI